MIRPTEFALPSPSTGPASRIGRVSSLYWQRSEGTWVEVQCSIILGTSLNLDAKYLPHEELTILSIPKRTVSRSGEVILCFRLSSRFTFQR